MSFQKTTINSDAENDVKVNKNRSRGARQVLGDLGNRLKGRQENKDNGLAKKKPKIEQIETVQGTMEMEMENNVEQEDQLLEEKKDVPTLLENEDDIMDTNLEDNVADLKLFDMDTKDSSDPQMASEYINEIMAYYRKVEGRRVPSPTYMSKQTDINIKMREILIDWLIEVHLKFKLRLETLYLCVNLIDRFLERRAVKRVKLQLVGCTGMLLASKYEEIYAPEVRDFVYISDKAYVHDQILAMESIMLNTLKFNLTVPTSYRFAERYIRVADGDAVFQNLSLFILESHLQKYEFLRYLPSLIAASAVYLALKTTGEDWDKMIVHTQYQESDLSVCVKDLYKVVSATGTKYQAVKKKYSSAKFLEVAKMTLWTPDGVTLSP